MQMQEKAKGTQVKHAERVDRQHKKLVSFFQRDTTQTRRSM